MSASIRTTVKIHVTGVTRVTVPAKHPDSLAFNPVTLQHAVPYIRCNARRLCNAATNPLPAAGRQSSHLATAQISLPMLQTRRVRDSALQVESHSHD